MRDTIAGHMVRKLGRSRPVSDWLEHRRLLTSLTASANGASVELVWDSVPAGTTAIVVQRQYVDDAVPQEIGTPLAPDARGAVDMPEQPGSVYYTISSIDESGVTDRFADAFLDLPAWNDDFDKRIALSGTNVSFHWCNQDSGYELGEPAQWVSGSNWWSWTAKEAGLVTIAVRGNGVVEPLVFTDESISTLQAVPVDLTGPYAVSFTALAGVIYQISLQTSYAPTYQVTLSEAMKSPPPQPASPVVVTALGGDVTVDWGASQDALGYAIERGESEWPCPFVEVGRVPAGTTTFTISQAPATQYWYRVRALGTELDSITEASAPVTIAPEAPVSLGVNEVQVNSNGTLGTSLLWSTIDTLASFIVSRRDSGGAWADIYTELGHASSGCETNPTVVTHTYTDKTLLYGEAYEYRVRASAHGVDSASVAGDSAVITPMSAPRASVSCNDTGAHLSWQESHGASSYRVYRGGTASPADATEIAQTTSLAFDDTTIERGRRYWYWVLAIGPSEQNRGVTSAPGIILEPGPTEISGTDGDDIITVSVVGRQPIGSLYLWLSPADFGDATAATFQKLSALNQSVIVIGPGQDQDLVVTINGVSKEYMLSDGQIVIKAGAGNDLVTIASGAWFTVYGESGDDTLVGSAGGEALYGGDGADSLSGGGGADYLDGGDGRDVLDGGDGDDVLYARDGQGADTVIGGGGYDRALVDDRCELAFDAPEAVSVVGEDNVLVVYGTPQNDVISVELLSGDDLYIRHGGRGIGYRLSSLAGIRVEPLGGDDRVSIDGGIMGCTVVGTEGADTITGGDGNDLLLTSSQGLAIGNGGHVQSANGMLRIYGTPGNDAVTVRSPAPGILTVRINGTKTRYSLAAGSSIWVDAGEGDDTVIIDPAIALPSSISGGAGNDTIAGGAGQDTLLGGSGADLIFGNAGADWIAGEKGFDSLYGGAGGDSLLGGAGADVMFGQAGNDSLNGGAGNDVIYGAAGVDTIVGGTGNDLVYSGGGNDVVYVNEGAASSFRDSVFTGTGMDQVAHDSADSIVGTYVDLLV